METCSINLNPVSMSYKIAVQKTKDRQYKVVLVCVENGKNVLDGKPQKNKADAFILKYDIINHWNGTMYLKEIKGLIPPNHKWTRNSGPKKKAAPKKPAKKAAKKKK